MKNIFRTIKYGITESFPVARWCLAMAVIAFSAVVSIYRYIDLSDMSATAFSSFETVYMVLNDTTNIIFIYLPLYLFTTCGIILDSNFGAIDIIKAGSRKKWLLGKLFLLCINTLVFFIMLFGMNMLIASRIFPFSSSWSTGFIAFRVMLGNSAMDFSYPPIITILLFLMVVFLLYMLCGIISMLTALCTDREETALLVSLLFGIGVNLFNMTITSNNALNQLLRCGVIIVIMVLIYLACMLVTSKKDFHMSKKSSLY